MKASSSTQIIVAIVVVVVLATGFWMLAIGPKRKEADELGTKVEGLQTSLAQSESEVAEAEAARRQFPENYRQLVVLGKAVPAGDETSSLLVQLSALSRQSKVFFGALSLGTENGSATTETLAPAPETPEAGTEEGATPAAAAAPTESSASLLPLGSSVGQAGLNTMPYDLSFRGSFFNIAKFIDKVDGLVHTEDPGLVVDGRLITVDGFSLTLDTDSESENPNAGAFNRFALNAEMSVTTYLVPPGEGLTAGATAEGPTEVATAPETTTEETPR